MMKKIVVGILAHVDSGKTTLSEALLYLSGAINKLGRVDRRDSFLDNFSVERQRGITVFSKQAVMGYKDVIFTLLDTPGHVDFSAEAERALQVLDYAILVISGTDGVQSHTSTLWKLLVRYDVPTFIFVNKMDLGGTDRKKLMAQLKEKLSDDCVDFGVGKDELYENVALCDERLLSKYYDTEILGNADIAEAVSERKVFPCMFGSALKLEGVERFLECIYSYTSMPEYDREFSARVFKISEDNQKNRLTFLKVTGGELKVKDILKSDKNTNGEKVNQIRIYSGEKFTSAESATPGTVCAVTGISFALPGDGLGADGDSSLPILEPVLNYTVELPESIDSHTALEKLRILEAEDPSLKLSVDENSGAIQVRLMGDIQLEILKTVIEERFGFTVSFGKGSIIYKETIKDTVEGVGHFEPLRHYAEVHLLIKPAKRDSGITINSNCREDQLDKNWQRLILTHLYEKTHTGVLTGSPITDVEITLMSGRAHPKHTEGGDFRQATYRAVRQGLRSAESVLLEPVYSFTLEVPQENLGRAISDIGRLYGSFEPPENCGDLAVIKGTAPASTMGEYSREVAQYTHGKGRLNCVLKGYEPCHNAEEVIEEKGYDPDRDTENTGDSVFCSRGAGHTVKWNEVKNYMHLPSVLEKPRESSPASGKERVYSAYRSNKDIFAADRELMQIFEQTYGPIKKREGYSAPRRYTAPKSESNYKKGKSRTFDGKEYVLVDGYNVIHAWEHLKPLSDENLDGAREALINILCNYQGYKKCELILVFDAYLVKGNTRETERINGIDIVYTKEAETADMYIEKTSHKLAKDNRVRVVTSDRLEQLIIIGNGAIRVSSEEFLEEIHNVEAEIREIISKDFK